MKEYNDTLGGAVCECCASKCSGRGLGLQTSLNGLKFHVQNKTPEWDREDMMMRWITPRY
jgi:hypothetical protein